MRLQLRNHEGKLPTQRAVELKQRPQALNRLLNGEADPNSRNKLHQTLLIQATLNHDYLTLDTLLQHGAVTSHREQRKPADVSEKRTRIDESALSYAVQQPLNTPTHSNRWRLPFKALSQRQVHREAEEQNRQQRRIAFRLLKTTDPITQWRLGSAPLYRTPLMDACKHGYYEVADHLLSNLTYRDRQDKAGKTAWMELAGHSQPAATALLKKFLEYELEVDCPDATGKTALMMATENRAVNNVRALLENGAAVNVSDQQGRTAFHYAASDTDPQRSKTVLTALIEDQEVWLNRQTVEGDTPLMVAAKVGAKSAIETLTAANAHLNMRDHQGRSALMHAILNNHPKTAALLLKKGAAPNQKNLQGQTVWQLAAESPHHPRLLRTLAKLHGTTNETGQRIHFKEYDHSQHTNPFRFRFKSWHPAD